MHRKLRVFIALTILFPIMGAETLRAENEQPARASLSRPDFFNTRSRINVSPIFLDGGSKLTVISPDHWEHATQFLSKVLRKTHGEFTELFGTIPRFKTSVRLMDEETFFAATGAPAWTNAMFYRGQIIIPLTKEQPLQPRHIARTIRHEYTHAVVHALSAGRCPGWLDEGIAQWAEQEENPALNPAVRKWFKKNAALPLNRLQGGFTKLENDVVPVAYGQSLFAAKYLMDNHGFEMIRGYFDELRTGKQKQKAFSSTFHFTEKDFEQTLTNSIKDQFQLHSH